ncbi:nuclear transport factor 2 family protein [Synechococcus sp. CS-1332]|uniref:YybH family protein n=1 Tax=Synechococcus sp. CS-1332 TaxID=2847972 RepID=UPI00223C3FFE|nr:nuclear transport factor 2 family protein [Synechococcus sp. CS-1332]MCT0208121.1 nuclear transport factor 2 family protein [Synechococcus sp. CS-1332]
MHADEAAIRNVLEQWVQATRDGRQEEVLANHQDDLVLFDVLSPLQYTSAAQYRASWDSWQPEVQGALQFALHDLSVRAGVDVGYAFGLLQCGGTLPDGQTFGDTVRITFCLLKCDGQWKVAHQHVSKPVERR